MKSGPTSVRGRSVAFAFWNVMWWSCGGFRRISRKSVWIFSFPLRLSPFLLTVPAPLKHLCLAATRWRQSTVLARAGRDEGLSIVNWFQLCLPIMFPLKDNCCKVLPRFDIDDICDDHNDVVSNIFFNLGSQNDVSSTSLDTKYEI